MIKCFLSYPNFEDCGLVYTDEYEHAYERDSFGVALEYPFVPTKDIMLSFSKRHKPFIFAELKKRMNTNAGMKAIKNLRLNKEVWEYYCGEDFENQARITDLQIVERLAETFYKYCIYPEFAHVLPNYDEVFIECRFD